MRMAGLPAEMITFPHSPESIPPIRIKKDLEGTSMHRSFNPVLIVAAWIGLSAIAGFGSSSTGLTAERMRRIVDFQDALNRSFGCEYVVSVGQITRYATSNSAGIILVDKDFISTVDSGSLFFAIAHEYAHAFLGHDLQLYEASAELAGYGYSPSRLADLRRRFEKEADGIAARKTKQYGLTLDHFVEFLLTQADPERGLSPDQRIYSRPKERAEYIVAVYRSASSPVLEPMSWTVPSYRSEP